MIWPVESSPTIRYRCGYKYQLAEEYRVKVAVVPRWVIKTEFIILTTDGLLVLRAGYAWDGPSGPTFDTRSSMRGSLVHDALYQLIREGHLSESSRLAADDELKRICLEDGMWRWRAAIWHRAVRRAAGPAAKPENRRIVYAAP